MPRPSSSPGDDGPLQLTGRAWGVLVVLCGALFLDALDVSMMGVALPSIRDDLDMSTRSLQWVVSSYVLGYGGFLLLGGRAADLFGRRRMFIGSLTVFLLFSGLGGLAQDGSLLIAARFVTGVAAAFTAPAGLSIITTSFAEGPARNRALSIYTATGATGFSLGLVAGGALTEVNWRWVFFVPVLIALVTLIGAIKLVPEPVDAGPAPAAIGGRRGPLGRGRRSGRASRSGGPGSRGSFDLPGAVSLTAAMLLLVFTVVEAPEVGWTSVRTLGSVVAVAAILAGFVAVERRTPSPLVRLGILRSGSLIRANVGAMALIGGWFGCQFISTLYAQQLRDWSALETGFAVFPTGVLVAVLAPNVTPSLVGRFGVTRVIVAGLAAAAVAYALFLRIGMTSSYVTTMLPTYLLVGVAFGLAYGTLNIAGTNGIAAEEQGLAGGLVNTSFQFGGALAVAIVTAVNDAQAGVGASPQELLDGFRAASVVSVVVALVGLAAVATGLRRRSTEAEAVAPDAVLPAEPPASGALVA